MTNQYSEKELREKFAEVDPIVKSLANKYASTGMISFDDAYCAGLEGAWKGIQKDKQDAKLTTYCFWWIRAYIKKEMTRQVNASKRFVSLDTPCDEDGRHTKVELIEARPVELIPPIITQLDWKGYLSCREEDVLTLLQDGNSPSEIAQMYEVSRQRICQLRDKAYKKLVAVGILPELPKKRKK